MNKLYNLFPGYTFDQEERIYATSGTVLIFISLGIIIIEEGIAPFFTRFNWVLLSWWWNLLLSMSGMYLLWKGLGNAINLTWHHHWLFKVVRWIVIKSVALISVILPSLFEMIFSESPPKSKSKVTNENSDDIWNIHPKHYYDRDPPPPFS